MRQLGVSVLVGAALKSGYQAVVGAIRSDIAGMDRGMAGLQQRALDLGQAWLGLSKLRNWTVGAMTLSDDLKDAAITAELADDKIGGLRQTLAQLSAPQETNRSVRELLSSYRDLTSAGLDDTLARHPMVLRAIGRTATATRAEITDLSGASYTLLTTLGIKPEGLSDELERLTFMGKKGKFELKDMARYLPSIGAAAKDLGLAGTEGVLTLGAAFQVATKTAGDNAEAANNLRNLLLKMTSKETVDNFRKAGVDIKKVFKEAVKKGDNPFETMLDVIAAKTKGDPFKISLLFPDQQAQMALKALLQYRGLYDELKSEGQKPGGIIDKDYARRMEEAKAATDAFTNATTRLGDGIGGSLLMPLGAAARLVSPLINGLADMSEAAPMTTLAITALGSAAVILPPALRLAAFAVGLFGKSAVVAGGGVRVLNLAMMANPVGLLVGALVIGAGLIYDNWNPIKNFFTHIWDDVRPAWESFAAFALDVGEWIAAPIKATWRILGAAGKFMTGQGFDAGPAVEALQGGNQAAGRLWDRVTIAPSAMAGTVSRPDFGIMAKDSAMAKSTKAEKGQVDVNVNLPNLPRGAQVETNASGNVGDVFTKTGTQMVLP